MKKTSLTIMKGLIVLLLGFGFFSTILSANAQSGIPFGATITSATLSIYSNSPIYTDVNVHRITDPWTETGVTWDNFAAGYDPAIVATLPASAAGWHSTDITALVQDWVNGTYQNYGVLLEQGRMKFTTYYSSEWSDPTLRPKLEICYTATGISNTCITIQRPGTNHVEVVDAYIKDLDPYSNFGNSSILYTGLLNGIEKQTLIRYDFGITNPSVSIAKFTNGQDASNPDGADVPLIKAGDTVTWTYVVTNTGNVSIPIADLSVTDDQNGVTPSFDKVLQGNTDQIFEPHEVWLYKATGIAVDLSAPPVGVKVTQGVCTHDQTQPARTAYVNQGKVIIPGASSTAKSSYCNPLVPAVSIAKFTNGQDASNPDGADVPLIKAGDTVTWTYVVTNTGQIAVDKSNVIVTDDQNGVKPAFDKVLQGNTDNSFEPHEVWLYKATGIAVDLSAPPAGVKVTQGVCTHDQTQPARTAYVNQGTVTIPEASSTAKSSYCNPLVPGISIAKFTNGQDASDPDGADVPLIKAGDTVTWTYVVTNTGQIAVDKSNVIVTDDQTGVKPAFDKVLQGNTDNSFEPHEVWLYKATGIAVDLSAPPAGVKVTQGVCTHDQTQPARTAYVNQGMATVPGASSTAKSSYCNPLAPGISIAKFTNGQDASNPDGADVPLIKAGDTVTWTYVVTNTGSVSVPIADLSVTDDQTGVTPGFDHEISGDGNNSFDPGEVWLYKARGIAVDLSAPPAGVKVTQGVCTHDQTQPARTAYVNQGTATVPGASSTAKSSYCNPPPLYKLWFPLAMGNYNTSIIKIKGVAVGFEDMDLSDPEIDYDYNDWITDINITGTFDSSGNNGLRDMKFNFIPKARGALYDHTFHLAIPGGTFGSDGRAVLNVYDQNHNVISSQTSAFVASTGADFVIFANTKDVLPDMANTTEGSYVAPLRYASLDITFNNLAPFDLSKYDFTLPHGGGLFFDPYLYVQYTGETIKIKDIRMLTVPDVAYEWPEEKVRIDKAYPDVTFTPGIPPTITFPKNWWLNHNNCVYGDGVVCSLSKAPSTVTAAPGTPVVTPGTPTVTAP